MNNTSFVTQTHVYFKKLFRISALFFAALAFSFNC